MSVVVFDPTAFAAAFPEFSEIGTATLQMNFDTATLFCNNTNTSIVQDLSTRTTLLNLLTAHITKLFNGTNNGEASVAPSDLVGRVEVAKEGSVHVRGDMGPASAAAAWFNQTRYGAMYWAATVKYRTLRYVAARRCCPGAAGVIFPWGWRNA